MRPFKRARLLKMHNFISDADVGPVRLQPAILSAFLIFGTGPVEMDCGEMYLNL